MTKQEFQKITGKQLKEKDGKLHYGGSLYLEGTKITALPDNLVVGGSLDLRGTKITALPDNLVVGGYLDLEGTKITALPDNLVVGGSLYLEGTKITALPDNLVVGGSLDLRGTKITALPDNLVVGGYLDLEGTKITALPDNLVVGGYLGLEGTKISQEEASRINKNAPSFYEWRNKKYIKVDGMFTEVVAHKGNVYRVKNIGATSTYYLITDGDGNWSHGENLKEAKEDLVYKITKRDKSEYEGMPADTEMSLEEGIACYRTITGACAFGTKDFIKNRLKTKKKTYTINEIVNLTKGEYGNSDFKRFFNIK